MLRIKFSSIATSLPKSVKQAPLLGFKPKGRTLSNSSFSITPRGSSRENCFTAKLGMLRTHQSGKKDR